MEYILKVSNLKAYADNKEILKGIDLDIKPGEVHIVMGPNGAGKSTLANALMGHPHYEVASDGMEFLGEDLSEMKVDERSRKGMFMSFQHPQEVPGVTVESFLRQIHINMTGKPPVMMKFKPMLSEYLKKLDMSKEYLGRYLNMGFSGGEKKKNEILQLAIVRPKLAILDETDSGLDVDAIKVVYQNIRSFVDESSSILIITHYNKILDYIKPDKVHVLVDGKIAVSGGHELADRINSLGYEDYR